MQDDAATVATLREQLAFAAEFRVPILDVGVGGYGEEVVKRAPGGTRWAVTDGAFSGLRAWGDGEGWRYITDIGRAATYRHNRDQALKGGPPGRAARDGLLRGRDRRGR
ncbi:hypothetical protein FRZ00_26670 [Streptomyces mobaraensis]|uniref:Uncharacterized protein n=1 Tax=Streptomyces mobaraensis TaxID=35621 RepID=A0A5N5W2I7_STRMB|nr:hypothetical protein FRZ00_26670 [Streptomyces mobaraensis]